MIRVAVALGILCAPALAQDETTPEMERAAAVALERARAARIEQLHALTWGEAGAPALFQSPIGPLVNMLVFSADSRHLAVLSNLDAWVLDLQSGKWDGLDLVTTEGTVEGPAARAGFLVLADGSCYRTGPGIDDPELLADDLPWRADAFPAPGGQRMVVSGLTAARQVVVHLVELTGEVRTRLFAPNRNAHATAVSWSPDGTRVAVAWGLFTSASRKNVGVRLYDFDGEILGDWPDPDGGDMVRAMEFAFDAKSLTVADGGLSRLDVENGEVLAQAEAAPLFWGQVDPVVSVSVQEDGVTFWDAERLRPARTEPIDEEPVEVRGRPRGPVLRAALSPKCDLLAVATARGLRVYRVRP